MNLKPITGGYIIEMGQSLNKAVLVARTIYDAYFYLNSAAWEFGKSFRYSRNKPEYEEDIGVVSLEGSTKALMVDLTITHPSEEPRKHEKDPNSYEYALEYGTLYLLSAEKEKETYTYGSRLRDEVDQIDEAIEILKEKPTSRQVCLTVARPTDLSLPDPPCLRLVDLKIYEEALTLTAFFRSWDIFGAANTNLMGLNDVQKWVAKELGVKEGVLQVASPNAHIYPYAYKVVEEWLSGEESKTMSAVERLGLKKKSAH
ncbi:MAG: thymidylate synthase [Candidatus Hodarchaeota archaeon]